MNVSKKLMLSLAAAVITVFAMSNTISAASEKTGVVTGTVVNFRKEPSLSSKVLLKLKKGTKVTVIDSKEDWYHVCYNDAYGWMHQDWLLVRDKSIASGIVTGSVVNVRSKPDTKAEVLTQFKKGTKVEIFEHAGKWYRVAIGEERYGWMHSDWVSVREEQVSRGGTQAGRLAADSNDPEIQDEDVTQDGSKSKEEAETQETQRTGSDIVDRQELVDYAKTLIGIKYKWGGETTKGFDCSGFVKYVYNHFGISIERKSRDQAKGGKAIKKSELKPGDLVFFDTNDDNGKLNDISHVGIYIGDGKFIHASTELKKAITIESMSSSYYSKRYMRARDYITK